jgi:hypothetical protein
VINHKRVALRSALMQRGDPEFTAAAATGLSRPPLSR